MMSNDVVMAPWTGLESRIDSSAQVCTSTIGTKSTNQASYQGLLGQAASPTTLPLPHIFTLFSQVSLLMKYKLKNNYFSCTGVVILKKIINLKNMD